MADDPESHRDFHAGDPVPLSPAAAGDWRGWLVEDTYTDNPRLVLEGVVDGREVTADVPTAAVAALLACLGASSPLEQVQALLRAAGAAQ